MTFRKKMTLGIVALIVATSLYHTITTENNIRNHIQGNWYSTYSASPPSGAMGPTDSIFMYFNMNITELITFFPSGNYQSINRMVIQTKPYGQETEIQLEMSESGSWNIYQNRIEYAPSVFEIVPTGNSKFKKVLLPTGEVITCKDFIRNLESGGNEAFSVKVRSISAERMIIKHDDLLQEIEYVKR